MARAESLPETAANFWNQQVGTWLEAVDAGQKQLERLAGIWMDQTLALQSEAHRFVREWMDSAGNGQAELWKAWQENLRAGARYFSFLPGGKAVRPAPK